MEIPNAPVTYALIVANIVASIYALFFDPKFVDQFAFRVGPIKRHGQHYRIFTSSFLHGGIYHLLFNMFALFSFGPYVEHLLGKAGFLVVYFGAILASGILSYYVNKRNDLYSSVGASDAVSGIIFSYILFYPLDKLYIFPLPVGIPAILFGVIFLVVSSMLMNRENRRIAHEGHLGGAVAGLVLTIALQPKALSIFINSFAG